jgi:DNA polymerase-3 subunit epsilon
VPLWFKFLRKFFSVRHIILDTETTGFKAEADDRLVEIGALELVNMVPTGRIFHHYLNPQRPIPADATRVHGITDDMVRNKPLFADVAQELLDFLADDLLVIHNAEFDMRFLNAAFAREGRVALPMSRTIDTLAIARKRFPGAPNSLDALCKRFEINLAARAEFHGALLDSRLLADVFLELSGGRQTELFANPRTAQDNGFNPQNLPSVMRQPRTPRVFSASPSELTAHHSMVEQLGDAALWG